MALDNNCSSRNTEVLRTALIFLAAFLVYASIYSHHFLVTWDDGDYIARNEIVHGLSVSNIIAAFKTVAVGNYAPLHLISYMVDYSLWGLDPRGYLFINVLIHAINGVLLYRILAAHSFQPVTALFAALIFVVHPIQVESVAWISQRKNLLCMLFFLLAFRSYLKSPQSRRHYLLSITYCCAALLTKPVAVIFPLVLALHALVFKERYPLNLKRLAPFAAVAVVTAAAAVLTQDPGYGGGRTPYYGGSPASTLMTMLPVLFTYVRLLFFPVGLSADYLVPIRTSPDLPVLASALFFCLLCILGYRLFKKDRPLFFWYSLFFLGLLPVSQIIPIVTLMNDRYLYFPMVGAAGFLAGISHSASRRLGSSFKWANLVIAAAVVVTCGISSWYRSHVWKDDLTLWRDATTKNEKNFTAWAEYGAALNADGQVNAALDAYKTSLSLNPAYWLALTNISLLYLEQGDLLNARHYIFRHIGAYPGDPAAYAHLGRSYYLGNDYQRAESAYLEALKYKPDLEEALKVLAAIHAEGNLGVTKMPQSAVPLQEQR